MAHANLVLLRRLRPQGRGEGGTLIFYSYAGSGPASTVHPQKKKQEFQAPPKIFKNLATPNLDLKKKTLNA